jgi:glycosyltransferase involved in cell wall biosynthesis
LKIAVNTRLLLSGKLEGIGWYSYETLRRITQQHPEHTFYFIFDRQWSEEFIFSDNIIPIRLSPPTRHPLLWYIWLEWRLPKVLKKIHADVFLSPDGFLSLSTAVPSVAVIHDLNFHHRPLDLPFLVRNYYQYFFPKFARKAKRIATVSDYSCRDIVKTYQIPASVIDVTPNGANAIYRPLKEEEKELVRKTYTQGESYFIFVGALHPRKNIPRLLQAYDIYRQRSKTKLKLLIVGGRMFGNRELEQVLTRMEYNQDVIFTGRVPADELRFVLGAAYALVFVPLFEGFGLPLVEAMCCDVPLISSFVTSMPEVAGDAAIYTDPEEKESIAGAMMRMAEDSVLHQDLVLKARIRRNRFSWDITADKLWECISKAVSQ